MSEDKSGFVGGTASASDYVPASYFRSTTQTTRLPVDSDTPTRGVQDVTVSSPDEESRTVLRPPAKRSESQSDLLSSPAKRTRKARLRLARVDPWSVMKTVFLFSVAGAIMTMVAVGVTWTVVEGSGLLDDVNEMVSGIVSTPSDPTPFDIRQFVNAPKVLGGTAVIAAINIVIFTALGTLGSFLYNLSATMLGGLEVTLAED